jgi:hypothetical protein
MRVRALRRRRLRPLVLGAAVVAALAAAGCGEKSEPSVRPPVTTGVTAPTTTAPGTNTKSVQTPTAPVPKTTP